MKRIRIICLALLLGISLTSCGGGNYGPGRDVCSWSYDYYYDHSVEQYVYREYVSCYDEPYHYKYLRYEPAVFPIRFEDEAGNLTTWSREYEGMIYDLLEFQTMVMEQGFRPLPP